MNPEQHRRASDCFLELCDLSPQQQQLRLAEILRDDTELGEKVRSMLEADRDAEHLVDITRQHESLRRQLLAMTDPGAAPERIGPYEVMGVLGEGGMGVVYEARLETPSRRVALKVVRPGLATDAAMRHFEHEVELLARLEHPGIARMYEAGRADGQWGVQPYFAMEYVDGPPLLQYADRKGLSVRERVLLFREVCAAVHYAHERRVVHRDLKPGNVLVDSSGHPRILDFGIAIAADQDQQSRRMSEDLGRVVGTVPYMSPEQAGGGHVPDVRSDVYSLGVILYELLCGQLPYPAREESLVASIRVVQEVEPTPPRQIAPELGRDLEAVLLKVLQKDRSRRYSSVSELSSDLRRWLADLPVEARPLAPWHQVRRFVRRHRLAVGSSLAALFLLLCGLFGTLFWANETRWANVRLGRANDELVVANDRASANLNMFDRVAEALEVLTQLYASVETAWPRRSEVVPTLERWLEDSRDLLARRGALESDLAELLSGMGEEVSERKLLLSRAAKDVGAELDRLPLGRELVEEHLRISRDLRQATLVDASDLWDEAVVSISDLDECPHYGGLEIEPQLGLIPLERDLDSRLWEFWLWESGEAPVRDGERWAVGPDTAMIFVLIPGGSFQMGGVRPSETASESAGDPCAVVDERPVREVGLAPFFLSKYETTQGQWIRLAGFADAGDPRAAAFNPSRYGPQVADPRLEIDLSHPVEGVAWSEVQRAAERLALQLPTEAQWEYAARAGDDRVWTGGGAEELRGEANLRDLALYHTGWPAVEFMQWNDGAAAHAPVGDYRPNPFGLYDMLGNVSEWCRDAYASYDRPIQPGDGLRRAPPGSEPARVYRGGSMLDDYRLARCRARQHLRPEDSQSFLGVRFARALDPLP